MDSHYDGSASRGAVTIDGGVGNTNLASIVIASRADLYMSAESGDVSTSKSAACGMMNGLALSDDAARDSTTNGHIGINTISVQFGGRSVG